MGTLTYAITWNENDGSKDVEMRVVGDETSIYWIARLLQDANRKYEIKLV